MECYTVYKRRNQVKLKCSHCNKEFAVSKKTSSLVTHCSRKCYIKAANEMHQRECKDCKKLKPFNEFNLHSPAKDIRRRYCTDCEKKRNKIKSQSVATRWKSSQNRSGRSGEVWEISLEQYTKLLDEKCHYCEEDLNPTGCGLDRKNNEIGYLIDNVVPCCRECNTVKNHFFTYEEMMLLSVTIKQIKNNRIENANRI